MSVMQLNPDSQIVAFYGIYSELADTISDFARCVPAITSIGKEPKTSDHM